MTSSLYHSRREACQALYMRVARLKRLIHLLSRLHSGNATGEQRVAIEVELKRSFSPPIPHESS